jgi:hypothetical protein
MMGILLYSLALDQVYNLEEIPPNNYQVDSELILLKDSKKMS